MVTSAQTLKFVLP